MSEIEENSNLDSGPEGWSLRDAFLAVAAFAVIIAVAAGGYFFYQSRQSPPVDIGSEAPDFSFPLLGGGEAKLSDYRGQVVLVNVWATWCNPCREEMPSMERLYRSLKGQPFVILAVSIDTRESTDVEPFVKQLGLSFPILLDGDKEITGLYHTSGVPESFIIDKDGVVVDRIIGPLDWSSPSTGENQLIQHLVKGK